MEWRLYIHEALDKRYSRVGIVLKRSFEEATDYAMRPSFKATNNIEEYEALIRGLGLVNEMKLQKLNVYSDSYLVACQIRGQFEAKEEKMEKYEVNVKK